MYPERSIRACGRGGVVEPTRLRDVQKEIWAIFAVELDILINLPVIWLRRL